MDKSWIALGKTPDGRMSYPYIDGVTSFIKFAMAIVDREGKISCPCLNCVNYYSQNLQNVQIHLLQHGIMQTYTIWHEHGEPRVSNEAHHEMVVDEDDVLGGIDALVEDRIRQEPNDAPQNEEIQTFDKLLNDAKREVYLGSTNYTLLKFVIELLNMKVTNHWSNKSVDTLLEFLTKLLPKDNLVPKSFYEAKKILSDLGLSYEFIEKEFGFLVMGQEFNQFPEQKIRHFKDWNWFLEEPREDSEDDQADEREIQRSRKGRRKKKTREDDDTLGGFIVNDDKLEEEKVGDDNDIDDGEEEEEEDYDGDNDNGEEDTEC